MLLQSPQFKKEINKSITIQILNSKRREINESIVGQESAKGTSELSLKEWPIWETEKENTQSRRKIISTHAFFQSRIPRGTINLNGCLDPNTGSTA